MKTLNYDYAEETEDICSEARMHTSKTQAELGANGIDRGSLASITIPAFEKSFTEGQLQKAKQKHAISLANMEAEYQERLSQLG